jgi:hypothetical protein
MFFVLKKYKYIRGFQYEIPKQSDNGYETLNAAIKAKDAFDLLETRPDLVTYVIINGEPITSSIVEDIADDLHKLRVKDI